MDLDQTDHRSALHTLLALFGFAAEAAIAQWIRTARFGFQIGKADGFDCLSVPHLHSLCEVPTFAASTNVSTFKITRLVSNSPHSKLAPFLVIVGQDPS